MADFYGALRRGRKPGPSMKKTFASEPKGADTPNIISKIFLTLTLTLSQKGEGGN